MGTKQEKRVPLSHRYTPDLCVLKEDLAFKIMLEELKCPCGPVLSLKVIRKVKRWGAWVA